MRLGNNYVSVIRMLVKPTVILPEGICVSKDGKEISNGSNGVSGIAPYDIETDLETVVWRGHEGGKVLCAQNIPANTIITNDANGKAIPYTGSGPQLGKTLHNGKANQLCKIYTYPVWGAGESEGGLDTFIITGGNSSDSLTDNLVDNISSTQYKIDDVTYNYPGGTDVAGTGLSETNYKVYLWTDNDVHFAETPPGDSIVIATYDTDAAGVITRYEPLEQFAILSTVSKLIESKNEVMTTTGTIEKEYVGTDIKLTWNNPIRIELLSSSAGASKNNVIPSGNVNLAINEIAYVTINRAIDSFSLTLNVESITTADLRVDDKIIFYRTSLEVYSPYFSADIYDEKYDISAIAGNNITAGQVVYLEGTQVYKAGTNISNSFNKKKGIALNTVTTGNRVKVKTNGQLTIPTWNFLTNENLFVSTEGSLTDNPSTINSGYIQKIATIKSSNVIMLDIQNPIGLS